MARVKDALTAQNATGAEINNLKERYDTAFIASGAAADVHAAVEFELQADWGGGYIQVDLIDPADPGGASIAKITGAAKAGYAKIAGAQGIRAKRLDNNGTASTVFVGALEPIR